MMRWLQHGYDVPLKGGTEPPRWEQRNRKGAQEYAFFLDEVIPQLMEVGAVEQVTERPHGVSPLNVVPKATAGKYRLILDLRYLNDFLTEFTFEMETLNRRRRSFVEGDWMFNLDLESGYYHVAVRKEDRKYLDDWCFMCQDRAEALQRVKDVLKDMDAAGLLINMAKSVMVPTRRLRLLGFWIDSDEGTFRIPEERLVKILTHLKVLAKATKTRVRDLAATAGRIMSCYIALGPATRIFTRGMYSCIEERSHWGGWVKVSTRVKREAQLWLKALRSWDGCAIWDVPILDPIVLHVDASDSGWGGWQEGTRHFDAHEWFTEAEAKTSSTMREMLGVERLLQVCAAHLRNRAVRVFTDSFTTTRVCIKGSPKKCINEVAERIFLFCTARSVRLQVQWVPREENVLADELSKVASPGDWSLARKWFQLLDQRWGPHDVDRMANRSNSQLPVFNSRWRDRDTAGVDCFAQDWAQVNNWVCPEFSMVERVLTHLRRCKATATVVVPIWETAPWWGTICRSGGWTPVVLDWFQFPRTTSVFVPEHAEAMLGCTMHNFDVVALRVSFA